MRQAKIIFVVLFLAVVGAMILVIIRPPAIEYYLMLGASLLALGGWIFVLRKFRTQKPKVKPPRSKPKPQTPKPREQKTETKKSEKKSYGGAQRMVMAGAITIAILTGVGLVFLALAGDRPVPPPPKPLTTPLDWRK